MRRSFRGKHIIVTGGSSGIGFAMAELFADEGADITLIARNADGLERAGALLAQKGVGVQIYSADVTHPRQLRNAIGESCADAGGLYGIIANSGYCHPGYFHEISPADVERQVAVNLTGAIFTLQAAIPILQKSGGGFMALTSSPAGNAPIYGFNIYGATKAALNNLSSTLRYEYQDQGISVHLLLPPDTQTPGYAREIAMYPPETRAVLTGGKLFNAEIVGKKFVEGIRRNKKVITVGLETHLLLWASCRAPWLWGAYSRLQINRLRRGLPRLGRK
jgi:3-dehydrosphinganine reductase